MGAGSAGTANRHRYYDPNTASFLTQDPIKLKGGINNYQYVPNPISWVDPLGLSCKEGNGLGNNLSPTANDPLDSYQNPTANLTGIYGSGTQVASSRYNDKLPVHEIGNWGPYLHNEAGTGRGAGRATVKSPSWTAHGYKHVAPKNKPWIDVVKSTQNGPAKYKPNTNIQKLEKGVWEKGKTVNNGKNWKVKEFQNEIGASAGKPSRWVRVENSADTIHGHPITKAEYLRLTK